VSDTSKVVNLRLSLHQEKVLNALVKYRYSDATETITWSASVPNRSEYIRTLIAADYKAAVTEGMEQVPR
jgi:hypothetical protein